MWAGGTSVRRKEDKEILISSITYAICCGISCQSQGRQTTPFHQQQAENVSYRCWHIQNQLKKCLWNYSALLGAHCHTWAHAPRNLKFFLHPLRGLGFSKWGNEAAYEYFTKERANVWTNTCVFMSVHMNHCSVLVFISNLLKVHSEGLSVMAGQSSVNPFKATAALWSW